jgi:hypothetical protein
MVFFLCTALIIANDRMTEAGEAIEQQRFGHNHQINHTRPSRPFFHLTAGLCAFNPVSAKS